MQLSKEISKFASTCESLIAESSMNGGRDLTEDEAMLVEYYCQELLLKVIKRHQEAS